LSWVGAIEGLTWLLSPIMRLFNLPPDAAISVVLGSIRKDGIAIGLLNPSWDGAKNSTSESGTGFNSGLSCGRFTSVPCNSFYYF
jgi:hypothetical protein